MPFERSLRKKRLETARHRFARGIDHDCQLLMRWRMRDLGARFREQKQLGGQPLHRIGQRQHTALRNAGADARGQSLCQRIRGDGMGKQQRPRICTWQEEKFAFGQRNDVFGRAQAIDDRELAVKISWSDEIQPGFAAVERKIDPLKTAREHKTKALIYASLLERNSPARQRNQAHALRQSFAQIGWQLGKQWYAV